MVRVHVAPNTLKCGSGDFRAGSTADADRLRITFKTLGFEVEQHDNMDNIQIVKIIEKGESAVDKSMIRSRNR